MKMSAKRYNILAVNPGSTSTKIALFADTEIVKDISVSHATSDLRQFASVSSQLSFRLQTIYSFLDTTAVSALDAVAGRGGIVRPLASGVYRVNSRMLDDCMSAKYGEHASTLGALIADAVAKRYSCPAFVADPVVVDELAPVARISGHPEIERRSVFHALNHKTAAREVAKQMGKAYEDCNFIVAHLGGGISIGAHCKGRVIDVNNALGGQGPFSPERAGGLPSLQLVELACSKSSEADAFKKTIVGNGGVSAYCGTNDLLVLEKQREQGDEKAKAVYEAMAYQIAKEIAMHGATLSGRVDRIIITGGMARDVKLVELITTRVEFLAPVCVIPGEREMISLKTQGVAGTRSAGLNTTALPKASEGAIFQAGIAMGKFHGQMRPTTPTGSRVIVTSTLGRTEANCVPSMRKAS